MLIHASNGGGFLGVVAHLKSGSLQNFFRHCVAKELNIMVFDFIMMVMSHIDSPLESTGAKSVIVPHN